MLEDDETVELTADKTCIPRAQPTLSSSRPTPAAFGAPGRQPPKNSDAHGPAGQGSGPGERWTEAGMGGR